MRDDIAEETATRAEPGRRRLSAWGAARNPLWRWLDSNGPWRYCRDAAEIPRDGEGGRPRPSFHRDHLVWPRRGSRPGEAPRGGGGRPLGADVPAGEGGHGAADRGPVDENHAAGQRLDLPRLSADASGCWAYPIRSGDGAPPLSRWRCRLSRYFS